MPKVVLLLLLCSIGALFVCDGVTATALTAIQRRVALQAHNERRSALANGRALNRNRTALPPGRNIYELTWSTAAERRAQAWADGCHFGHSAKAQRGGAGQNLFATTTIKLSYDEALRRAFSRWWDELTEYGLGQQTLKFAKRIGHFTQMAWAKTTQVGCGVAWCPMMTYVVCNYLPAGNVINANIYEAGSPCSNHSDCITYERSVCRKKSGLCSAGI